MFLLFLDVREAALAADVIAAAAKTAKAIRNLTERPAGIMAFPYDFEWFFRFGGCHDQVCCQRSLPRFCKAGLVKLAASEASQACHDQFAVFVGRASR